MRVLFSESPPLKRKNSGQPPFLNGLENGSLFVRAVGGWGLILVVLGHGDVVCKAGWDRVSLKSCSGAILNVSVWVVPGVSVV